jgi:hypothetical protein
MRHSLRDAKSAIEGDSCSHRSPLFMDLTHSIDLKARSIRIAQKVGGETTGVRRWGGGAWNSAMSRRLK